MEVKYEVKRSGRRNEKGRKEEQRKIMSRRPETLQKEVAEVRGGKE